MNQYYIKRYIDKAVKREIRYYRKHQDGMLDSLKAKLKEQANKLKETISRFRANKKVAKIAKGILQAVSLIIGAHSVVELYTDTKELNEKLQILKEFIINSKRSSDEMKSAAESKKSDLIFKYRVKTILNSFLLIVSVLGTYLGQKSNKSI